METKQTTVGRWESRGGKYWLELYRNEDGTYSYRGKGEGGYLAQVSEKEAIDHALLQVSFWPVKNPARVF